MTLLMFQHYTVFWSDILIKKEKIMMYIEMITI